MRNFLVFAFGLLTFELAAQQINLDPATTGQALVGQRIVSLPVSGDFIVSGYNTRDGFDNAFVARHNAGGTVWAKTLSDTLVYIPVSSCDIAMATCRFNDMLLASNGDIVIVGEYQQDALAMRLNQSGDVIWAKVLGTPIVSRDTTEVLTSVSENPSGEIIVAGTKRTSSSTRTQMIGKLDAAGNILWWKSVDRSLSGGHHAERVFASGDSIFLFGSNPTSGGPYDISVTVFDNLGVCHRQTTIGSTADEFLRDAVPYQGGFLLSYRGSSSQHLGLVRTDGSLNLLSASIIFAPSGWTVNGGYLTTDGTSIYMTGQAINSSPDPDMSYSFVSKVDQVTLGASWTKTVYEGGGAPGKGIIESTYFQMLSYQDKDSSTGSIVTPVGSQGLVLSSCEEAGSIELTAYPAFFNQVQNVPTTTNTTMTEALVELDSYQPVVVPCGQVLPVELASFDVEGENETALVTWQTASEQGSSHFDVERSVDGRVFESVGSVEASRNSQQMIQYEFVDESPLEGLSFYRLKSVDLDGSYDFSNIKPFSFWPEKPDSYLVYPNPARLGEAINIKGEFQSIQAFDHLGREASVQRSGSQVVIKGSPGVYNLIIIGEQETESVKVVLN
ncbi:MAG: T9SS type A sorting domain-containing protein [Candidatus Paceibacterota bacterium]